MKYKTLAKICGGISFIPLAYMFLISYEGTNIGWIIFFVFMGFASLFHNLDQQRDEIILLRYIINRLKYGTTEEKNNASCQGEGILGEEAKKEIEEKYNLKSTQRISTQIKTNESEIQFIPKLPPKKDRED